MPCCLVPLAVFLIWTIYVKTSSSIDSAHQVRWCSNVDELTQRWAAVGLHRWRHCSSVCSSSHNSQHCKNEQTRYNERWRFVKLNCNYEVNIYVMPVKPGGVCSGFGRRKRFRCGHLSCCIDIPISMFLLGKYDVFTTYVSTTWRSRPVSRWNNNPWKCCERG